MSGGTPTDFLNASAGFDRQIATADDQPLIASRQLLDTSSQPSGRYEVWLSNDNADGVASPTDSNQVLNLKSVGQIGRTRKTVEVTVKKGAFRDRDSDTRMKSVAGFESLVHRFIRRV